MSKFAKNHWYAAVWARELSDAPLARRLLDEPIVLFRKKDGRHRGADRSLSASLGTAFHGRFGGSRHSLRLSRPRIRRHRPMCIRPKPRRDSSHCPSAQLSGVAAVWAGMGVDG